MRVFRLFVTVIAAAIVATSCNNDFSPNAEWRETMVVCGLLDQDEDTTWIRVQKCFLGEGDMLAMTSIMDSSNYAEGELSVRVVEWNADSLANGLLQKTSETGKVFDFEYKLLTNKAEGGFSAPNQPVYFCRTKNQLKTDKVYELRIHNNKTGMEVNAETSLIGNLDANTIKVNNNSIGVFTFSQGKATVTWPYTKRARVFQPMLRFYYRNVDSDSMLHADILFSMKEVTNELQLSTQLGRTTFGNELSKAITDHETPKIMGDTITLFLFAGDENFKMYRSISAPPSTIVQERGIYTNINGGLGIFASRRTHIKRDLEVPPNTSDANYRGYIKSLNIGF